MVYHVDVSDIAVKSSENQDVVLPNPIPNSHPTILEEDEVSGSILF